MAIETLVLQMPNILISGLSRVAGASGVLVVGRLTGTASSFFFTLVLARTLAPEDVGALMSVMSLAFLASVLVTLNIESGSIRFLAAAHADDQTDVMRGFVFLGRAVLLAMTPIIVGLFLLSFFVFNEGAPPLRRGMILLVAAAIPVMAWLRLSGSHATALGNPLQGSLPRTAAQPVVLLVIYATIASLGPSATTNAAAASFLAAFVAAAILQSWLLRSSFRFSVSGPRSMTNRRDWLYNGLFFSPLILLQENLQYSVIIVASMALDAKEVAMLAIPLRFVAIIRFGVMAVNMAASPLFAKAMAKNDTLAAGAHLRNAAIIRVAPALLAAAVMIGFARPILSIFGPEYEDGASALAWFTLIPLSAAVLGPNQMVLNIAGERRAVFYASCAALAALIFLVPMAAQQIGVTGAAAVTALVYAFWELALCLTARAKTGIDATVLSAISRRA